MSPEHFGEKPPSFLPTAAVFAEARSRQPATYALCYRPRLLDLACNQICDEGAVEVLLALQKKSSRADLTALVSLGLGENSLSNLFVPALAQFIESAP
jgi:hypothetical protein